MKTKIPILIVGTVALAVALVSCGNKQTPNETSVTNALVGKSVDVITAGSITGTIKLDGIPPQMKVINMAAEPSCAKDRASQPAMTEDVVPGDNVTIQNVVVYLEGDLSQYTFTTPTAPVTFDQKGCQYHPHVLALMMNQPLQVINSDPVTHNIHPVPKDNREWNQSQPPGAAPINQTFARPEVAIPVKCNIHPWMKGYIAVFSNPYAVRHHSAKRDPSSKGFEEHHTYRAIEDGAFEVLDALRELPQVAEVARRALWAAFLKGAAPRPGEWSPQGVA